MRMITISAFKWVPEFARGQVRDLRARWALEEAGLPYETRLLGQGDQDKPEYRAMQPFGQVPILEEAGALRVRSHRAAHRRAERGAPAEGSWCPRTRDAVADSGAQFDRALRDERGDDRSVLRAGRVGEAATPRCRRVRAEAPVGTIQVAG